MTYIIYSETEFESDNGTIHKGDHINTLHGEKEDEEEIRQWLINQYLPEGINVSYQLITEKGKEERKYIQ